MTVVDNLERLALLLEHKKCVEADLPNECEAITIEAPLLLTSVLGNDGPERLVWTCDLYPRRHRRQSVRRGISILKTYC